LARASFVVRIAAFHSGPADEHADVLLPMAAFTESAGVYLNCEGRVQRAEAAARPLGEARPAWKILRVLGNFLDLPGFDYVSLDEVNADIPHLEGPPCARHDSRKIPPRPAAGGDGGAGDGGVADGAGGAPAIRAHRLLDMPMYRGDATLRNADALQATADNPPPAARMSQATAAQLGVGDGDAVTVARVTVKGDGDGHGGGHGGDGGGHGDGHGGAGDGDGEVELPVCIDARVPAGCVYIPAGFVQTAPLGGAGVVTVKVESSVSARADAPRPSPAESTAARTPPLKIVKPAPAEAS